MAKRKYTRKQLKQPDEFITFSMRVWSYVQAHVNQALVMVAVALVVVAGVWIFQHFAESRAREVTTTLTHAVNIYNKPVVKLEAAQPQDEDGVPSFKTKGKKLEASIKELTKVVAGKSSGQLPLLATLVRAGAHFDNGQHTEAIKDYDKVLAAKPAAGLKFIALEGLIYSYEATKQLDKAMQRVKGLPRDGDLQYDAMYHEGRVLALMGKKVQAAKMFQQILDKASDTELAERAGKRLALLESK